MKEIYKIISITVLTITVACNSQVTENQLADQTRISPKITEVNWDSITIVPAKGKIIDPDSVESPEIINAGIPETHKIYSNILPAGKPKEYTISKKLPIIVPGEKGVPLPKINKAIEKVVLFNYPKPVSALEPQFKDVANSNIRYLDIDQGMSSSYVRAILADSRGNFWIGTLDKGVSLYDGEHFTHFTEEEGLSSNTINTIFEDSKGNIWFGTWGGGACMYNGEYFTHFTEKEGLSENHIYSIFEDSKGNIWFGTEDKGACVYNGKNFRQFTKEEGLSNNIIRAITQDTEGNIWFGTYGGGLIKYSVSNSGKESFTTYTEDEGLNSNYIRALLLNKKGELWIGTDKGLSSLQNNKFSSFSKEEGFSQRIILALSEDKKGNIWIGTRGMGVSVFDGKNFTNFGKNEGLSDNIITSIIEDNNGIIWFGTQGGGLNLYKKNSFKHLTEKEGLNDFPILSVLVDSRENIWIGSSGGGLSIYNGKTISTYTKKETLSYNYVYSLIEDQKGNIWIGTIGGGVSKFTYKENGNGEFSHFGKKQGLTNRLILGILGDNKGNIWFSAKGEGLFCFNGTSFINYNKNNGLNNNTIFAMLEDHKGNLWFGTYGGGINRFDGKNFSYITSKNGLMSPTIFSLYEDTKNNIWIGTEKGGVYKYNGKSIIQITEKDGLNSNVVGAIIEDNKNQLWLGTNNGLNVLQKESTNINKLSCYNKKDGLKDLDFSNPSLCLDKKNQIWWANGKNLTIINLNSFELRTNPPNIELRSIEINQEHIDYRRLKDTSYCKQFSFGKDIKESFSKTVPFTNIPELLKLPYDIDHLTFHFSTDDRHAPHKIKYSYFMKGLDKEWSIPNRENKADYRNIPSGKYTFKVRANGESQKWSNTVEYSFTIETTWWLRWWAYLIYFISLLGLIYLIVLFRTTQLKTRQKELTKLVNDRTKEIETQKEKILTQNKKLIKLDEFKQNLTSMIVHDLKNPLNNILSITDEKQVIEEKLNKTNYSLIRNLGNQMLNLTLNMLDVSKCEETSIALKLETNHLKTMANRAMIQTDFLVQQKNISIKNHIKQDYFVNCDREITERIFVNLLTNAIKYTPQNEDISISCEEKNKNSQFFKTKNLNKLNELDNILIISINDSGEGIAADKAEHIFTKFGQHSKKKSGSVKSTGLGLTFCKLAIEAHGGTIGFISKPKKGSSFWFTLKKSKNLSNDLLTESLIIDKSEHLTLTKKDIENIAPLLREIRHLQFYEVTEIKKLLQDYDFSDNIVLQKWKDKIEHSVISCNKQEYEIIINQKKHI